MAKRKYSIYQVHADFGEFFSETNSYREAFTEYQKKEAPKTMYGITEQGEVSVILSKG